MSEPAEPRPAEQAGPRPAEEVRLQKLLEPVVQAHRLYLEDVSVKVAGAHRTVHVVVDLPETETGGVSLDVIAEISRELSAVLDADPQDDSRPYDLEVSSPGVSRPLTEPRHWRRALGRLVKVDVLHGDKVLGRLAEVGEDGIVIVPDLPARKGVKPKQGDPLALRFDQLRSGRVEIEFTHLEEAADDVALGNDDEEA